MRHFAAAAILAFAPVATVANAAEPAAVAPKTPTIDSDRLAVANEIAVLSYPSERRVAMYRQQLDRMMMQLRGPMMEKINDAGLRQILDSYLNGLPARMLPLAERHMPLQLAALARAYTREFSLEELREIRRFVASSVGSRFLQRSPELQNDPEVVAANQAYINDYVAQAPIEQKALQDRVMAYLAKHPELADKISLDW